MSTPLTVTQAMSLLDMLHQQLSNMEAARSELRASRIQTQAAAEALKDTSQDVLVPLGAGVLVTAQRANVARCLYSVGAGVLVGLPAEEAVTKLEERGLELERAISELARGIEDAANRAEELQAAIEDASARAQSGAAPPAPPRKPGGA